MREIKTDRRLLANTQRYRLTMKGVITNSFAKMKERCIKYGRELGFTCEELKQWALARSEFHNLYANWANAGYQKALRPSFDRKDPLKGYLFLNLQILTYQENRDKGDAEKEILWGKPILQLTMDGRLINRFPSIKQAVKTLGLSQGLVSNVLTGRRNHTGGFRFQFENPSLLTPPKQ